MLFVDDLIVLVSARFISAMEANSSGEEVLVKTRKPYTITKQRERWTEEEHNRFLEALKLYGRAWLRIEEYIGTKTAVQIRSHAQKFFSKLEKEAFMKGVPLGQAHDIEIPPPRPKRKPCNPYPRKIGAGFLCPLGEAVDEKPLKFSSSPSYSTQLLYKESSEPQEITIENETLQRRKEASEDSPPASISSVIQTSSASGAFRESVSLMRSMKEKIAFDESSLCTELNNKLEKNGTSYADPDTGKVQVNSQTKPPAQVERADISKQSEKQYPTESYTYSEMSSIHQSFPACTPFTQFQSNLDAYRPFHNISSTLSNLIVASLLQNPAVHAAATLAASLWPPADVDSSNESSLNIQAGEIPVSHMNPSPSMAAIAAATVAAASAWWAAQGLLPLFAPLHPGLAFATVPAPSVPIMEMTKVTEDIKHATDSAREGEALIADHPASKLLTVSPWLSESDGSERGQIIDIKRSKKLSSSGSNIPSSSELDTNAILENRDDTNNEAKQVHFGYPLAVETNNRRFRINVSINESWKEVSEEGRIAFQELFSRDVLPQSFSPTKTEDAMVTIGKDKIDSCSPMTENRHGNLKARRIGFKPYKRCSVEANENRASAGEETGSKRMRT